MLKTLPNNVLALSFEILRSPIKVTMPGYVDKEISFKGTLTELTTTNASLA